MSANTLKRIKELSAELSTLENEIYESAKAIGKKIETTMTAMYKEFYPDEKSYYIPRWIDYADEIQIDIEDGDVYIDYIERGRFGNSDESLHRVKLTEEMFTDEGLNAYFEERRREIQEDIARNGEAKKQAKINEIRKLEAQLATLKGE